MRPLRALALLLPLAALSLPSPSGATPPEAGSAAALFGDYVRAMDQVASNLNDAMFTFHRNEWVPGAGYNGPQRILVKYLRTPGIYMKWETPNEGREVLWVKGVNDGDMWVNAGRMVPTLSLDPEGSVAMEGSRYPVWAIGLHRVYGIIYRDANKVSDHPTWAPQVEDLGAKTIHGEAARCFKTETPKAEDPALYAYRTDICFSERLKVPLSLSSWDVDGGKLRMVEEYSYEKLRLNVGLKADDFSAENPKYGF